jgi:hypothetical protein
VTDGAGGAGGSEDRVQALYDHLAATGERPVERTASHYLGEAEAVVADALAADGDEVVVRRVRQARDLLAEVEETGDEAADEHVAAARRLCARILDAA